MNVPSLDFTDMILADPSVITEDLTFAVNLFIGKMPDAPDLCVCIYDTGGPAPAPNYVLNKPTIQIRVRGSQNGYQTAYDLAQSIKEMLGDVHNRVVNSTRYIGVWVMSEVSFVGYGAKDRPEFTFNLLSQRTTT